MEKKNQSSKHDKQSLSSAKSPITNAVAATMPLVYSAQIAVAQSSGPLPPPAVLRAYEDLKPGTADRILKMAEDEANHRRQMEAQIIAIQGLDQRAYRRSELFGQIFGLTIGVVAIIGAVVSAIHGAQIAAAFIGTSGVTGLVTAFIVGRNLLMKQMRQEFEQQQSAARQQREDSKLLATPDRQDATSEMSTQQVAP